MTNETIGHYGFHPGGGYQPIKTNKIEFKEPPTGSGVIMTHDVKRREELWEMLGDVNDNGFYNITTTIPIVTELELKIRKDVMDAVDEMTDQLHSPQIPITHMKTLAYTIKDRLNLLWGE